MLVIQDWLLVLSLAEVLGNWALRCLHHRLPCSYNTTMPRILASALVLNELVVLLMVVRPVSSVVDDIVLVVCDPHEDSLQALADPGWMQLPI
jgi:hypothetical protein